MTNPNYCAGCGHRQGTVQPHYGSCISAYRELPKCSGWSLTLFDRFVLWGKRVWASLEEEIAQ